MLDDHQQHHADQPLFLYLALPVPDTPWLPSEKFRGTSKAEDGDYAAQVDDVVGQMLNKLDALAMAGETLTIFTSDNGPVWYPEDLAKYGHAAAGPLRDEGPTLEGGHRMPFVARWPGHIKAGSVSGEMICFTDMLATFAEIVGTKLPENAGNDSLSILPLLRCGVLAAAPVGETMVIQSGGRQFGIRHKQWMLIMGANYGKPRQAAAPQPGPAHLPNFATFRKTRRTRKTSKSKYDAHPPNFMIFGKTWPNGTICARKNRRSSPNSRPCWSRSVRPTEPVDSELRVEAAFVECEELPLLTHNRSLVADSSNQRVAFSWLFVPSLPLNVREWVADGLARPERALPCPSRRSVGRGEDG